jgi:hypothetical protein
MPHEGDVVEFIGRGAGLQHWECHLGGESHQHTDVVRVKLGAFTPYRWVGSECLTHPNFLGRVNDTRRLTVVIPAGSVINGHS